MAHERKEQGQLCTKEKRVTTFHGKGRKERHRLGENRDYRKWNAQRGCGRRISFARNVSIEQRGSSVRPLRKSCRESWLEVELTESQSVTHAGAKKKKTPSPG